MEWHVYASVSSTLIIYNIDDACFDASRPHLKLVRMGRKCHHQKYTLSWNGQWLSQPSSIFIWEQVFRECLISQFYRQYAHRL